MATLTPAEITSVLAINAGDIIVMGNGDRYRLRADLENAFWVEYQSGRMAVTYPATKAETIETLRALDAIG